MSNTAATSIITGTGIILATGEQVETTDSFVWVGSELHTLCCTVDGVRPIDAATLSFKTTWNADKTVTAEFSEYPKAPFA